MHSNEEWETIKPLFKYYYMDLGMSLKAAASKMRDDHDFDASPRQWENRIGPEKWGLQKYISRESRLKSIHDTGRSLLEVGQRRRRNSTSADGRPALRESRNLRRFARREMSREARRHSRSVGAHSIEADPNFDTSRRGTGSSPGHAVYDETDIKPLEQKHSSESMVQPPISAFHVQPLFKPESTDSGETYLCVPDFDDCQYTAPTASAPNSFINCTMMINGDTKYCSNHQFAEPPVFDGVEHPQTFDPAAQYNNLPITPMDWDQSLAQPLLGNDFSTCVLQEEKSGCLDEIALPELVITEPEQEFLDCTEIAGLQYDSVHADVYALLHDHQGRVIKALNACLGVCERIHNPVIMLESFGMFKTSLQAEHMDINRMFRTTLRNIAATQWRAAQDIRELSRSRKRFIEQMHLQNPQHYSNVLGMI